MFEQATNYFIVGILLGLSVGFIGGCAFALVGAVSMIISMAESNKKEIESHKKEIEILKEDMLRMTPVVRDKILTRSHASS